MVVYRIERSALYFAFNVAIVEWLVVMIAISPPKCKDLGVGNIPALNGLWKNQLHVTLYMCNLLLVSLGCSRLLI